MNQLGVFAKYWLPGAVKTRLAAVVGPRRASQLYLAFLEALLRRCESLDARRTLVYSPESRSGEFQELVGQSSWTLRPQGGGDLGRRLERYLSASFASGAQRVAVIGSDSPNLPLDYVRQAFERLRDHPVVLGPASDGGYYLVGASGAVPPIFDDITWSTDSVWRQTTARLERARIPFAELPAWYDVDDANDLARLRAELAAHGENRAGPLAALHQRIDELLGEA